MEKLPIQPGETVITGSWSRIGEETETDSTCRRIQWLISSQLKKVSVGDEWEALYQDPSDERYWLLSYPKSHWHGGGPPELKVISPKEAIGKFGAENVI